MRADGSVDAAHELAPHDGAPHPALLARIAAVDPGGAFGRQRQSRVPGGTRAADRGSALSTEVAAIRAVARQHSLHAAVAVTHALDAAFARGERGPLIRCWLELLADAVGCGRHDAAACETFSAACYVRLAG